MEDNIDRIEIKVIELNEQQQVAIHIIEMNKMILLSYDNARSLAFKLMECADFIDEPFKS